MILVFVIYCLFFLWLFDDSFILSGIGDFIASIGYSTCSTEKCFERFDAIGSSGFVEDLHVPLAVIVSFYLMLKTYGIPLIKRRKSQGYYNS